MSGYDNELISTGKLAIAILFLCLAGTYLSLLYAKEIEAFCTGNQVLTGWILVIGSGWGIVKLSKHMMK